MNIDKPDDVLLLQGYHVLGATPVLMVSLAYVAEPDGRLVPEAKVWPWLDTHFPDEPFDNAFKKAHGGYGVAGFAYAPGGEPTRAMAVQVQVGALRKTLHVHGERRWQRGPAGWHASTAQPFTAMAVSLRQAYGGEGYAENPYGIGFVHDPDLAHGQRLPNIELPEAPVLSPHDRPEIATFCALPMGAPSRQKWVGTVGPGWEQTHFPWLPDDTHPRWFDGVPADQVQSSFWRGDESWYAQGMHETRARVSGRLPQLRPRLLFRSGQMDGRPQEQGLVRETPLDLDTVWLFPNDERVMVVYRGSIPVTREDAADVAAMAVFTEAAEDPAQPLSVLVARWLAGYKAMSSPVARAPVPAAGVAAAAAGVAVSSTAPVASGVMLPSDFSQSVLDDIDAALRQGIEDGNAMIADVESAVSPYFATELPRMTLPAMAPPSAPPFRDGTAPPSPAEIQAEIEHALQTGQQRMESIIRDVAEATGQDAEELLEASRMEAGLRKRHVDMLDSLDHIKRDMPWLPEEAFGPLEDDLRQLQSEIGQIEREGAALSANLMADRDAGLAQATEGEGGSLAPISVPDRETLEQRLASGQPLAGLTLRGLDMRGLDLSAVDLAGTVMEACCLAGVSLAGAVLKGAQIRGSDFSGVDLTGANLEQADIQECDLTRAVLVGAEAAGVTVSQSELDHSDWSRAMLDNANIGESSMATAAFDGASIQNGNLWAVDGEGASFRYGRLAGLRLDSGVRMPRAVFEGADLGQASLQEADLSHARFDEAFLGAAFVRGCNLEGSRGRAVAAQGADFKDSRFVTAQWPGANFLEASFDYAVLDNLDWRGVNLHAADVRTAVVQGIDVRDAYLGNCPLLALHAVKKDEA